MQSAPSEERPLHDEFADRVAVVTGAGRGLGKAVAALLGARGAKVILLDVDKAALEATAQELRGKGHKIAVAWVDAGNEDELAALRSRIEAESGRLDILVNNAGGWRYGRAGEITLSDWDWTFRTNVTVPFLTTRVLMDLMIPRSYGRIVNVASTDAYRPKPKLPHYAAAKAAVVSLTKSLAEELAPHQILVNGVSPGPIATETAKQQGWLAERAKSVPLGRIAEPEDIAEVIAFLASSRNRYIVGETIIANGGLLLV
jgi:NAD(P)-dependent dehydrogenase (short-subunit alcohol dehydrogenase family)